VYSPIVARQQLGEHVPTETSTCKDGRIVGHILYAVHAISKEGLWVCLCIPLLLLGKGSVIMLLQQQGIVGGIILYAVHVTSKESK
jgi:hypothetical protein